MDLRLRLYTDDPSLSSRLMGRSDVDVDDEVEIADDIRLQYQGQVAPSRDLAVIAIEILSLVLSFASGVASNIVAARLCKYLEEKDKQDEKQSITRVTIYNPVDGREYPIDIRSPASTQETIEKVIAGHHH